MNQELLTELTERERFYAEQVRSAISFQWLQPNPAKRNTNERKVRRVKQVFDD